MVGNLGSLFDGIGGFPLAGRRHCITPVWASEIEPWPIRVTEHHFPRMIHLGDIAQINGAEIEPVDIITFGSPCQDLSVAGKRAGLEGQRSGLFMEAVRIIREMRVATDGCFPRYAIWENVPGAYSSNGGQDFRAVLEEIAEAEIPMPTSGKWAEAGMVRTERVDVAWRTLDAQYWGVPQRRKRIFLVADFAGHSAGEILFVEPRLSWNFETGGEAGQEAAATVGDGVAKSVCIRMREGCDGGGKGPLISEDNNQTLFSTQQFSNYQEDTAGDECYNLVIEPRSQDGVCRVHHDVVPTLNTAGGGQRQPCVMSVHQNQCGEVRTGDVANTLSVNSNPSGRNAPLIAFAANQRDEVRDLGDKSGALQAEPGMKQQTFIARTFQNTGQGWWNESEVAATVRTPCGGDSIKANLVGYSYAVRRLTPLECLRLQGFPDWWLDIEGMSDTAKYKAVGNSVAVPCVEFVMSGIARVMKENNQCR